MTTPSGRPGFNAIDRFGITGDDGSVPDLVNRTQEVITGVLKERMKGSPAWNGSTADVWAQLRRGIPLDHALLEVIVNRLTGGLVTFPTKQDAIMALKKVPFLSDVVELLTGVEDGDENDLGTFFLNVRKFFQSVDFSDPHFDPEAVHRAFVEIVVQPFIKSITSITAAMLGAIGIGQITDEIQTLLYEGGFDDPITIVEGDGVTHDATDGAPGSDPLGCARVACDGTYKMRWSDPIKVGKGWSLKAGAEVKYEALVATAGSNAVRVELQPYKGATNPQPVVWMASDESPSGTEPWGDLNAWETYVVPTDVTHVAIGWGTTEDATDGVAKFDNVYLESIEKLPQSFTKDLPEDLTSLLNFIQTWVHSALTALGITPSGVLLDDIFDLSDEIEWIRDKAQEGAADALEALTNLSTLANKLLTDPASVLGPIGQSMVTGLVTALGNFNTAVNQIGDALIGAAVTPINAAISNVLDFFHSLVNFQDTTTANQINQQNFQIAALASGIKRQAWESRYPVSYVSFPELFLDTALYVSGTTGAASAGTAHTHSLNGAAASAVRVTIAQGQSFGSFIGVSDTTIVDTIAMKLNKDTAAAINNVFLECLREDPAGGLTVVGSVDVSAPLTTSAEYVQVALPAGVIVNGGERYVVRIRNASTVANGVGVTALRLQTGGRDLGFATVTAADSNKTTYTPAEALAGASGNGYMAWGGMAAVNADDDEQTHTDDFNNRAKPGSLWFLKSDTGSNQLGIAGGKAAFSGLTDGVQNGIYVRPTGSDKMWVEATLYETAIAATGPRCGLLLNCNRDLSQIVYLGANLNSAKIYTGAWNALTERASVSSTLNDVPWQFYYDPATGTYYALKDGQDIGLNWPDTGSLMQHGPDFRYGGLRIARASFFNAGRIDNWTLRDWVS